MPPTTVSSQPELSKGELTRRAILEAAVVRFGREGFRTTSVADIARDASIGGSVPYSYFADKESLFLAAVDEDAAAVVNESLASAFGHGGLSDWRQSLLFTMLDSVGHHPLARRLLAGLEPEVTARVLEIPALNELRKACADRLRAEQLAGSVRADIDPASVANGVVAIMLSLLMSIIQLGDDTASPYTADVVAVFEAALAPPPLSSP